MSVAHVLTLIGTVPSKKNRYRRSVNGGMYTTASTKALLDGIILQAQSQWKRPPVVHPDMDVTFYVQNQASDRDNKVTALLDCLVKARVLCDDSISKFNGTLTILPAQLAVRERTIVRIR